MYKVDFSLNSWNFVVNFNKKEDYIIYKEIISNSVIDMCHKPNNYDVITINYWNDENIYNSIYNSLNIDNKKVISSFMNEYYDQYNDIFVSSQERYLIKKNSELIFELICKNDYKRPELIYLIREIYVRLEENIKSIFIHGNGISIDNKGLIISGNSGSGKTTFMLKLFDAEQKQFNYLSNDRIFLTQDNRIEYFPIPLILANGTAKNIKSIRNFLLNRDSLYDSSYTKEMLINGKDDDKYALYKKHLKEIFPYCSIVEQNKLDAIIMPKINFNIKDINVRETKDYTYMMPMCFTPIDSESLRKPWIQKRKYSDEELFVSSENIIKNTIENSGTFIVEYNPNIDSRELKEKVRVKILERI